MDFNRYADCYDQQVEEAISFSGKCHAFFLDAKVEAFEELMTRHFGTRRGLSLLDLGCGVGELGRRLSGERWRLTGVDVAVSALRHGRKNLGHGRLAVFDGQRLPFADGQFDVAVTICVVHHVAPERWPAFFAEMARVVRPHGLAVVFEHNPLNPLTRWTVSRCEFDADAVLLGAGAVRRLLTGAGLSVAESGYLLYFPWVGGIWRWMERRLTNVPLGAQYWVAGAKPQSCSAAAASP